MNRLPSLRSLPISLIVGGISLVLIAGLLVLLAPKSAAMVTTFTVNSTLDTPDAIPGDGVCADPATLCTLRAAIMESNASTGAHTINVPAGTYALTLAPADDEFNLDGANELTGDLDIQNNDLTIIGAGAASTIINGAGLDRIFDVNNPDGSGIAVNVTLQGLRLTGGNAPTSVPDGFFEAGGAIQFNGRQGATPLGTLTITNCEIQGNTAAGVGGGIKVTFGSLSISGSTISGNSSAHASGGGVYYDGGAQAGVRSLQVNNSTISNNQASDAAFGSGGGLRAAGNASITIENNTFNANQAGTDGGGLALFGLAKSVNKNKITNNSAGNSGGGVFRGGSSSATFAFRFNVVVGNTASAVPTSSGLQNLGVSTVENDWWGCNQGPSSSPCDRASGVTGFTWLVLSHTASPNSISVNTATTLQADFFSNNMGTAVGAADLVALDGRAVLFNNPVLGTISNADTQISGGKANATYTAGPVGGSGRADATVDHATVTALISIGQQPSVITNPTDQTVCNGGTATFTAASNGSPAPTVQWQVSTNGGGSFSDIPGATSTTLSFTATTADNGNQYHAVFTNASGSATTTAATLTVNTAPTVTTNPANTVVCEGGTATFTAAASGSPAPTVQWQVSTGGPFSNIPGETNTTLTFTATTAQNGNQYRAVFTNSCSTATTTAATLTVNASTSATPLANQTVCQGATANFSTTASGTGPFTYQWKLDGNNIAGATNSSVAINTTSVSVGNHTVEVVVGGSCGSVTKNATLNVQANTTTTDPPDVAVCEGSTASFTTTASGTAPFSYVWKKGAVVLATGGRITISSSGNTSTLTISNTQAGDAGTYTVETTGACGTASQSANLSVDSTPPTIILNGNTITLAPPNHQYHTVNVTDLVSGVSDSCDNLNASNVTIAQVTSDELEESPNGADGNTFNDIVISCNRHSVQLRAERDGNSDGRVYTITFTVTDSQGHVGTATAKVTVQVNQNGAAAVDSGPHYIVLTPTCP